MDKNIVGIEDYGEVQHAIALVIGLREVQIYDNIPKLIYSLPSHIFVILYTALQNVPGALWRQLFEM
jgi:type III secretion system FlhB-like substrate exporter